MATPAVFEPGARVQMPPGLKQPFDVYVNGIKQAYGTDYRIEGKYLLFRATLVREGKLGFWRWLMMFIGLANTYRANDGVDIATRVNGRPVVVPALDIETLGEPRTDKGQHGARSFEPRGR